MQPIVEIVGASEPYADLEVAQRLVVAAFGGDDEAYVGYCDTHSLGVVGGAVVVGDAEMMLRGEGEGEFLGAIEAEASGVDAYGGDVAAHGTGGIAHGHATGGSLVLDL